MSKIAMIGKKSKIIVVGHTIPDPNWKMRSHHHPFNEMIIIIKGKMQVEISKQNIHAVTGDILFYPAGVAHREQSDCIDPVETIFFGWNRGIEKFPFLFHDTLGRIRLLVNWLYEERKTVSPYSCLFQETILEAILAESIRLVNYKDEHPLIEKIRGFIHDNLKKNIKLDDLANYVNMSKYHFLRKYKNLTGRTPMEDLRINRVETAKELILSTNLPLKTIAPEVGFANEYHLSRMFRKYLNLSPGYFRRNTSR